MNVGELIKELKKYPRDCLVGKADHDNSHSEVSGLIVSVFLLKQEDNCMILGTGEKVKYPDCDCVVVRC